MISKFENKNEEEKLFKKRLLDRTLHENTGSNLCFSIYRVFQKFVPILNFTNY